MAITLVRYDQIRGPYKAPVKACSKTNISISSAPAAAGGVTLTAGDRVGLVGQTAPAENGIYIFTAAASPMLRAKDADSVVKVMLGLYFLCTAGTNAGKFYQLSAAGADPIVLDTSSLTFTETGSAAQSRVVNEVPTGTKNGTNLAFTLANTPISGSVEVYLNGILRLPGSGNDYQISGTTVTFETGSAPDANDTLVVHYMML